MNRKGLTDWEHAFSSLGSIANIDRLQLPTMARPLLPKEYLMQLHSVVNFEFIWKLRNHGHDIYTAGDKNSRMQDRSKHSGN